MLDPPVETGLISHQHQKTGSTQPKHRLQPKTGLNAQTQGPDWAPNQAWLPDSSLEVLSSLYHRPWCGLTLGQSLFLGGVGGGGTHTQPPTTRGQCELRRHTVHEADLHCYNCLALGAGTMVGGGALMGAPLQDDPHRVTLMPMWKRCPWQGGIHGRARPTERVWQTALPVIPV